MYILTQVRTPVSWAPVAQAAASGHSQGSHMVQLFDSIFRPSITPFSKQIYGRQVGTRIASILIHPIKETKYPLISVDSNLPCIHNFLFFILIYFQKLDKTHFPFIWASAR